MPSIDLSQINYLAVVAAALATFFLGGFWYTALAKPWQRLHGYSDEKLQQMKKLRPPSVFFGGMIVAYVVLALVIAILFQFAHVQGVSAGAFWGFLLWLGPCASICITGWIASDKPAGAFLIDAAYQFVYLILMGAILGGWR